MNTRNVIIGGIVLAIMSLAVVQVFAMPEFNSWRFASMMGSGDGHTNRGDGCNMMNGQAMTQMMDGQSMNYQRFQQHMGPNGNQMMKGQYDPQQCQQYTTAQQFQAMNQSCHK